MTLPINNGAKIHKVVGAEYSVESQKNVRSSQGHVIKHLSITSNETERGMASRIQEVNNSTVSKEARCEAFFENEPYPLNHRDISSSETVAYTCTQAEDSIEDIIGSIRKGTDYNGFNSIAKLIGNIKKEQNADPLISEYEAFQKLQLDSSDEVFENQGGSCVGQAHAIVKALSKIKIGENQIKAYVVTERNTQEGIERHAAVVVVCTDGVVLIEISWDNPTTVIRHNEQIEMGSGKIKDIFRIVEVPQGFFSADKPIIARCLNNNGTITQHEYLLRPAQNADAIVMKNWILHEVCYPVTGYDANHKNMSVIKCDLARNSMVFQVGEGKNAPRVSIPFAKLVVDIENRTIENLEFQDFLKANPIFFNYFKANSSILLDQIETLAKHSDSLLNLHLENEFEKLKKYGVSSPNVSMNKLALIKHSSLNKSLKDFVDSQKFSADEIEQIISFATNMQAENPWNGKALQNLKNLFSIV